MDDTVGEEQEGAVECGQCEQHTRGVPSARSGSRVPVGRVQGAIRCGGEGGERAASAAPLLSSRCVSEQGFGRVWRCAGDPLVTRPLRRKRERELLKGCADVDGQQMTWTDGAD